MRTRGRRRPQQLWAASAAALGVASVHLVSAPSDAGGSFPALGREGGEWLGAHKGPPFLASPPSGSMSITGQDTDDQHLLSIGKGALHVYTSYHIYFVIGGSD